MCNSINWLKSLFLSIMILRMELSQLELVLGDKSYRSMINNKTLVYLMQLNAYYCGVLATPLKKHQVMPSVDLANVSHVVPSVCPIYFIGTDAEVGTAEFKSAASKNSSAVHSSRRHLANIDFSD